MAMDEFNSVAPYSSEFWEQERARNESKASLHGNTSAGLGFVGPPVAKAFAVLELLRSVAYAEAAKENARRAKQARDQEEARRKQVEQAEKESAERARAQREKEDKAASDRNYRDFGVRKPVLVIGRDIPEPGIDHDYSDVA
jgi:hypothetical protein